MKTCFEVVYEKAGAWHNQTRYVFAESLQEAQEIACLLCDDYKPRVLSVQQYILK